MSCTPRRRSRASSRHPATSRRHSRSGMLAAARTIPVAGGPRHGRSCGAAAWLFASTTGSSGSVAGAVLLIHGARHARFEPGRTRTLAALLASPSDHARALRCRCCRGSTHDRAQLAGFALLGLNLAMARAAAVRALGAEAAIGADSAESSVGAFEEVRQWLTSTGGDGPQPATTS